MGKFKDVGNPALALAEECSEVIQVIAKLHRFEGSWDEIPDGKEHSRWMELLMEMDDVMYQWERLKKQYHKEQLNKQPMRYDVKLFSGLTIDQRVLAYQIMGYVLLDYKREHCVPLNVVRELQVNELLESFHVVMVMS